MERPSSKARRRALRPSTPRSRKWPRTDLSKVRPIFDSVTTAPGGSAPFPYPEETEFGQAEKAAPQGVPEVVEVANQPYGGRQAGAGREAPEPPSYVTEPTESGEQGLPLAAIHLRQSLPSRADWLRF